MYLPAKGGVVRVAQVRCEGSWDGIAFSMRTHSILKAFATKQWNKAECRDGVYPLG